MRAKEIAKRLRRARPLPGQSLQELMDLAADEIDRLDERNAAKNRELAAFYGLDIPVEPLPAAKAKP